MVSRHLGAGDTSTAARAAGNAFTAFWATAVAITVVGLTGLEPLLRLLGARGATLDYARDYAVVILAGAIVSTGFSSLVRAEGRMRFATMLWVVPVAVQITLDPLLIFGLDLGVRGAALGTVGGQAVSAAMSMWFFFVQKHRPYRIHRADLRPHLPTVRTLVGIGAPSFLAGFGATLLVVVVNTTLSRAAAGITALAAFAICARLQTFVAMPQLGISQGMQPIVGYNAGRGFAARVRRTRDPVVARHPRLQHRRRRMRRAARRADRGRLRRRRHRPGRVRRGSAHPRDRFRSRRLSHRWSPRTSRLSADHDRPISSPSGPCCWSRSRSCSPSVTLGTTGTWTGLAAGELRVRGLRAAGPAPPGRADHARRHGDVGDDRRSTRRGVRPSRLTSRGSAGPTARPSGRRPPRRRHRRGRTDRPLGWQRSPGHRSS